jgi:hypothetical protein
MVTKTARHRKPRSESKAQAIRDEFAAQGRKARPKNVIAALEAKGVSVSSAQVSNIKAALSKRKPGRKAHAGHGSNGAISLASLVEAKKLADRLGGIELARHAIEALAKLS